MGRDSKTNSEAPMTRREFLQRTTRTVAGATAVMALGGELAEAAPVVDRYRVLGRTGLKVTTISFGGILIDDRRVLDYAIDQGINLVHTAPGYRGGNSIRAFGEVMKTKRDKVVLAVKVPPQQVDEALKMLNTDHIDIAIPDHGVSAPPFPNDDLRAAYDAAKKAGKIRFTGFATHGKQIETIQAAMQTGYFDVMLVGYNMTNRVQLDPVIREARKKHNIGFLVMKSAVGLKRDDPQLFAAGLKDLLTNRDVHSLLIGMGTYPHVQQNVAIMGQRLTRREKEMLDAHLGVALASACTLCGHCSGVCPQGIPVADVMRCELYAERGDADLARSTYSTLEVAASACTNCGACTHACPKRLNVPGRVQNVHATLA